MTPHPSPDHSPTARDEPNRRAETTRCRVCGTEGSVRTFLALGLLPLGNAFIPASEVPHEEVFPLSMGFCERCFLVQIQAPAPVESIERVYRRYSYVPTGTTLAAHYRALAAEILDVSHPRAGGLFVDVGSNDGLLLGEIRSRNPAVRIVGVEPSDKISEIAKGRGIPTLHGFFDAHAVETIQREFGSACTVSATQVFQHLRDPEGFLRQVHEILEPNGVLVLEGRAYFPDVAEKLSFDTFYHELLFCFTAQSLSRILERAGFTLFRAERTAAYGGSLRVYARRTEDSRPVEPSVKELLEAERRAGVTTFETYRAFGRKVEEVREELSRTVRELKSRGKSIVGYGAPSTGSTLLTYAGLGQGQVDYIVDDNPLKQGLVMPGTHIPITDSGRLSSRPPEFILLVAWRLRDEILAKLEPMKGRGLEGVIVPLPWPELVA